MNDSYFVYMHISPNGKRYIGITQNYDKRWRNGLGYWKNKYFYNAIKKYGWDNFKHEIIAKDLSLHDAEIMEIELISKYNSNNRQFGYNHAEGGKINRGYKLNNETRKRLSESHKGIVSANKGKPLSKEHNLKLQEGRKEYYKKNKFISPMKGKQHSEETKRKISKSLKEKNIGSNNYWYGKHFSNEHKNKISKALSGRKFSEKHKAHLSKALSGKTFSDEHISNLITSHKSQNKKIVQKSLNNEIIKVWDSIGEASRELNIQRYNISRCLIRNANDDKQHKTCGYIFEYYKGDDEYYA